MLEYILEISKQHNEGMTNPGRFQGLQIGARGIKNKGSLRYFKSGLKDYKSRQGFQIGAKRFHIWAEITNQGKRDYKPGHEFLIRAGIRNWCRTTNTDVLVLLILVLP